MEGITVDEVKYNEIEGKLYFGVNYPRYFYLGMMSDKIKEAVYNTLENIPENIEVIRSSLEQFNTVETSENYLRTVLRFKYKKLSNEELAYKVYTDRINYFLGNLQMIN